jgi:hypothetical protein
LRKYGKCGFFCRAFPLGRVRIAAPAVLVQHQGRKRLGEAQKNIRHASAVVTELSYLLRSTERKHEYFQKKMAAKKNEKCSVLQSEANLQRLTVFFIHLSFRWTLPLKSRETLCSI